MAYKQIGVTKSWIGLSTDTKPSSADTGDGFYEYDTRNAYIYGAEGWVLYRENVDDTPLTFLGTCGSTMTSSTTILLVPDLAGYGDDIFNGKYYLQVLYNNDAPSIAPENQIRKITDYSSTSGTFTVDAFTAKVNASDKVLIIHESLVIAGRDDADNVMSTSNVTANRDGTIVERTEFIIDTLLGSLHFRTEQSKAGTVEENGRQSFNISVFDVAAGAINATAIDITSISAVMWKSDAGAAFATAGITQPTFSVAAGRIYTDYQFLAAEWAVGDLYKLVVGGITVTLDADTLYVPTMVWSNAVIEAEDLDTYIEGLMASMSTAIASLGTIENEIDLAQASIATALSEINLAQATLSTVISEINLIQASISTIVSEINLVQASISTIVSEIDLAQATLSTVISEINLAQASISTAIASLGTIENEIDLAQASISTALSEINLIQASIATALSEINLEQATLSTVISEINLAQASIATALSEINLTQASISTIISEIDLAQASISTANANILILETGLEGGTDAVNRATGKTQYFIKEVSSSASVGDITIATTTSTACNIKSIIVVSNGATSASLTNLAIYGGTSKCVTFIDSTSGLRANFDATDKQVSWSGDVALRADVARGAIVMTLTGTGPIPVDLTVFISYEAAANGGYLA